MLARCNVYWPKLDAVIKESGAVLALQIARDRVKTLLFADIARLLDGRYYFVKQMSRTLPHSHSHCPFVNKSNNFCHFHVVINGRSLPSHLQNNRQAFVDTFNRGLAILKGSETTIDALQTFLMAHRSTPCPSGLAICQEFSGTTFTKSAR